MTAWTTLRGHHIHYDEQAQCWRFTDTGERTDQTWQDRPCGLCGRYAGPEGHDPCLGTLPGVMNACCGHGDRRFAYVQFPCRRSVRGRVALWAVRVLQWWRDRPDRR